MATDIESYLFTNGGTYALIALALEHTYLVLKIAPWSDLSKRKNVLFDQLSLFSVISDHSISEGMPFDIIGIDCKNFSYLEWEFYIHCSEIDISFRAKWPIYIQ